MMTFLPPDLEPVFRRLNEFLIRLGKIYRELENHLPSLEFKISQQNKAFRFASESHTDTVACFLKGAKTVSTLNACMVLLQVGHAQEIGALSRVVEDMCNEILFLIKPTGKDGLSLSDDQEKFLDAFYKEEFADTENIMETHLVRDTVQNKKILAGVARLYGEILNPSDAQQMGKIMQRALSGYVHGAYPQIMEMYGGNPARFHLFGHHDGPRVYEWFNQLLTYIDRTILISVLIAKKMGAIEIEEKVRELKEEFETVFATSSDLSPKDMMKAAKSINK